MNAFTGVADRLSVAGTPEECREKIERDIAPSGVMSGAVSPMPRARSPAAIASMTGVNPARSTPLRRRLFLRYSAPALPAVVQRADGRKFRVSGSAFLVQRSSFVL
ncbi:hypothetical protein GCM10010279_01050 [Streptomyces mutabilis]|nr:hypothetical protein GCM10010279_01050 [Streptomyces mutabilis]